jgi:peptidoglycan hydrolase CwlO-like protein
MKKKNAVGVTAASVFLITMVDIILFALKKNKVINQNDLVYNELNGDERNLDSKSVLSIHESIEQKINEAATKIKNQGSNFSMPVGEFGTFL